jgi:ATP/maltotriose-dependent transcriptional regulator MalT
LIRRYYATMRGGEPDPAQVEAIIRFARGLPMVVTSAVQLWVKYGMEDFQSVKAEIVANLVDRLMEGVPSSLIPALEAAAVVRWFDQPILRAVTKQEDVRDVYNELRRFPFVRSRSEGLALHDSVREMMDENLRVQDSERHAELHERAAVYFEKRLEKVTGEDAERLGLERLYHRIRADEDAGIKLFQEMAEELIRYRLVNRLRALLNDASMYPLERENSKLWQEYYKARLAHSESTI